MRLSIITINKNNSAGLQKTIESVIHQTFTDYEFIIIDGSSTDSSVDIIKKSSEHISHWISEPDKGVYHAMNKGIALSKGEYCYFLNSGDRLVHNTTLKKVFSINPYQDVIFGNLILQKGRKRIRGKKEISFFDVYHNIIKHQASFVKKELLLKNGCYNESFKIIADCEFMIKTVGLGKATYQYLNTDVAFFDTNGISYNNKRVITERNMVENRYIPKMMQPDYAFLKKNYRYQTINNYWLLLLFQKLLYKTSKLLNRIFDGNNEK